MSIRVCLGVSVRVSLCVKARLQGKYLGKYGARYWCIFSSLFVIVESEKKGSIFTGKWHLLVNQMGEKVFFYKLETKTGNFRLRLRGEFLLSKILI